MNREVRRKTGEQGVGAGDGGKRSWRSDETHRETQNWSERDAISRPYLVIMSPCFKVQSVPVMLLHNCASREFPHRSDDKKTSARSVHGAPTHSFTHCGTHFKSMTNHV